MQMCDTSARKSQAASNTHRQVLMHTYDTNLVYPSLRKSRLAAGTQMNAFYQPQCAHQIRSVWLHLTLAACQGLHTSVAAGLAGIVQASFASY